MTSSAGLMSSDLVGPGGGSITILETILEGVEDDSGTESSGHWVFSADNTDTDSVIQVIPQDNENQWSYNSRSAPTQSTVPCKGEFLSYFFNSYSVSALERLMLLK